MNASRSGRYLALASSLAIIAATAPAVAQEGTQTASVALDEILVTARKFSEDIQTVPLSISVLSAQELDRAGVDDLEDIASKTIGFSLESFSGPLTQPVVRGMTQLRLTSPAQNVPTFLNGVYLPRGYMIDTTLVPLERVEVVKGPQSAQFGKNAFAGAVSIISKSPDLDEFKAEVSGTIGTDERRDIDFYVSAPIVEGKIAASFGFSDSQFDGTWKNNHPLADAGGFTDGNLGGWSKQAFYGRVTMKPVERLTIDAFYVKTKRKQEHNPSYNAGIVSGAIPFSLNGVPGIARISPFNVVNGVPQNNLGSVTAITAANPNPVCAAGQTASTQTTSLGASFRLCEIPGSAQNRFYVGEIPVSPVLNPGETARVPGLTVDPRAFGLRGPTEVFSAKIDYELTDAVTASYQWGRTEASIQARGSSLRDPSNPQLPFGALVFGAPSALAGTLFDSSGNGSNLSSTSHEARLTYDNNSRIKAFAGVFYSKINDIDAGGNEGGRPNSLDAPIGTFFEPTVGGLVSPSLATSGNPNGLSTYIIREDKTWSVFGLISFDVTDTINITAEGRYADEKQSALDFFGAVQPRTGFGAGAAFAQPTLRERDSSYFTPRVSVTWQATDSSMVYVNAAKGVKSGGLNGNMAFAPQLEWQEETNWTYEVGSKNRFMDGRMKFNFALYRTNWKNIQSNAVRLNADGTSPTGFAIVPTIVGNVGDVSVWGGEVDTSFKVTQELTLNAAASYARSRYKDGTISQRFELAFLCDDVVCPKSGDISGNQLERTPSWEANAGFTYDREISDDLSFYVRSDLQWQSKMYLEEMNVGWVSSRTLVNGAIGVRYKWVEARLWADNLFNKKYVTSALALIGTGGARSTQYAPFMGEQRTIGLTLSAKY
jgi:iron complex outermembrane recepter protein